MRILIGVVLGFQSGFLIFMAIAMLFSGAEPSSAMVYTTILGGWALSTWGLLLGARSVSKVFKRGFLLGAIEWLAMIPVGVVYSGRSVADVVARGGGTDAELAGATIGAGLVSFVTSGVAVVMALVCLICFAVTFFFVREMKPEVKMETRRCPECAELIMAAARKCKHCGSSVDPAERL